MSRPLVRETTTMHLPDLTLAGPTLGMAVAALALAAHAALASFLRGL